MHTQNERIESGTIPHEIFVGDPIIEIALQSIGPTNSRRAKAISESMHLAYEPFQGAPGVDARDVERLAHAIRKVWQSETLKISPQWLDTEGGKYLMIAFFKPVPERAFDPRNEPWIIALDDRIEELARLPANHDGEGASPVQREVLLAVRDIVKVLFLKRGIRAPHLFPLPDGGVEIEIETPVFQAGIWVHDTSRVEYIVHRFNKSHSGTCRMDPAEIEKTLGDALENRLGV